MISLKINALPVSVEEGARSLKRPFFRHSHPHAVHRDGLSPTAPAGFAWWRSEKGRGQAGLFLHPPGGGGAQGQDGFVAGPPRPEDDARTAPGVLSQSKVIQDLAAAHGCAASVSGRSTKTASCAASVPHVQRADAGRRHRVQRPGEKRAIGAPFQTRSEACRLCGACMYVCRPASSAARFMNGQSDLRGAPTFHPLRREGLVRRPDVLPGTVRGLRDSKAVTERSK